MSPAVTMAQDTAAVSVWNADVIPDGDATDWPSNAADKYDSKTGIHWKVANDSSYLFLSVTVDESLKMRRMMRAGWKLILQREGEFTASLTFPEVEMAGPKEPHADGQSQDKPRRPDTKTLIAKYIMGITDVTAAGFKTRNGAIQLLEVEGIMIGIGTDTASRLIYEIGIPLKELSAANTALFAGNIGMKVNVNAMEMPNRGGGGQTGNGNAGNPGSMGGSSPSMGGGYGAQGGYGGYGAQGTQGGGASSGGQGWSGSKAGFKELFEKASFTSGFRLAGKP